MRPVKVTLNAVGVSQWIPLSYVQPSFGVGLGIAPWYNASGLTCHVEHTFDDLTAVHNIQVTRSGTTATVFDPGKLGLGHGLSTGDCVIVRGSGSTVLNSPVPTIGSGLVGNTVTVTGVNSYTYTVANSGPTADQGVTQVTELRVFTHDVLTAVSTRTDGNYQFPVRACRLNVTALVAGGVEFFVLEGIGS